MKKLLVKAELIDIPYSPEVQAVEGVEYQPATPELWTREVDGEIVESSLERPLLEDGSDDPAWTYHPATEEILAVEAVEYQPEQPEVRSIHLIDQTQGMEDELNIWLSGNTHKYPSNYFVEWVDLTQEYAVKQAIEAKLTLGRKAKEACQNVLDLISGYNLERELSVEQVSNIQSSFAPIEGALQSGRPSLAKFYISQVEPDGVLVTQEMKDMALLLLSDY